MREAWRWSSTPAMNSSAPNIAIAANARMAWLAQGLNRGMSSDRSTNRAPVARMSNTASTGLFDVSHAWPGHRCRAPSPEYDRKNSVLLPVASVNHKYSCSRVTSARLAVNTSRHIPKPSARPCSRCWALSDRSSSVVLTSVTGTMSALPLTLRTRINNS
jgi:hypothetical protein